ncbi:microtubule-associated protein 10 [Pholidichthys leucotaenia]
MSSSLHDRETLFSFELLVDYIRVDSVCNVSEELALGVRLLDFPTLLIHQPQPGINRPGERRGSEKEYIFNRGKSCFFKMNFNSLHVQLHSTPLYAMVLDVKEEIPRLVGSCLISLAKAMDRITKDVAEGGVFIPSSHTERGLVGVCNLAGERIGAVSLSYKLLCLGASLLPHITEREQATGGERAREHVKEEDRSMELMPLNSENDCLPIPSRGEGNVKNLQNEDKRDDEEDDAESHFQEDLAFFCPPHLYYSSSAKETHNNKGEDYKLSNLDPEPFLFEDPSSEDENKVAVPNSVRKNLKVRQEAVKSGSQETNVETTNVLREALRRLPLLNALLAELSQLNGNQSSSSPPSSDWIYRPAPAVPSTAEGSTPQKAQTKSLQKASPRLEHLHPPRNCSTPTVRPSSLKIKDTNEEGLTGGKNFPQTPKTKLVYGTTKTFNLRLKRISPLKVQHRECVALTRREAQSGMLREKTKSRNKPLKNRSRKLVLNQSASNLNENIETAIQTITLDSALQETVTLKYKNQHGGNHYKQGREAQRISDSVSERDLKFIHIPRVDTDSGPQRKDKRPYRSESDQSQSQSDRCTDKVESSVSSRRRSPNSSFSDSSGARNEEADYADDFNSLEPSDAYSPDLLSSPEPSRAKTPQSPIHPKFGDSDSGSEGVQKRAAILPVPVKAAGSPQRALMGTHVIRPRTHSPALSFSSSDGDRDESASASLQTVRSQKQMAQGSRGGLSSGSESVVPSRSQRSDSTQSSIPAQGLSSGSLSSFEPQEPEELEDKLGSLDFREEYKHISELVASKLPGYTI